MRWQHECDPSKTRCTARRLSLPWIGERLSAARFDERFAAALYAEAPWETIIRSPWQRRFSAKRACRRQIWPIEEVPLTALVPFRETMTVCQEQLEKKGPMRQSIAAFGVFRRAGASGTLWLAQWNGNWNKFNFVGGHKRSSESFRQCAIREVAEELEIVPGEDYVVGDEPAAHLEYVAWSGSANEKTAYTIELFDARLRRDSAALRVDANPANRWLTEREILAERTSDGRAVSETMARLLTEAQLLGPGRLSSQNESGNNQWKGLS